MAFETEHAIGTFYDKADHISSTAELKGWWLTTRKLRR